MDNELDYHVGRAWTGHQAENECPCPQEPCGLVQLSRAVDECDQHPAHRARSIRQGHTPENCPG